MGPPPGHSCPPCARRDPLPGLRPCVPVSSWKLRTDSLTGARPGAGSQTVNSRTSSPLRLSSLGQPWCLGSCSCRPACQGPWMPVWVEGAPAGPGPLELVVFHSGKLGEGGGFSLSCTGSGSPGEPPTQPSAGPGDVTLPRVPGPRRPTCHRQTCGVRGKGRAWGWQGPGTEDLGPLGISAPSLLAGIPPTEEVTENRCVQQETALGLQRRAWWLPGRGSSWSQ